MAGLRERLTAYLLGQDMALNGLGGGEPRETISGTIGRGLQARAWWAPASCWVVDGIFGAGHCAAQAAIEEERRRRGA